MLYLYLEQLIISLLFFPFILGWVKLLTKELNLKVGKIAVFALFVGALLISSIHLFTLYISIYGCFIIRKILLLLKHKKDKSVKIDIVDICLILLFLFLIPSFFLKSYSLYTIIASNLLLFLILIDELLYLFNFNTNNKTKLFFILLIIKIISIIVSGDSIYFIIVAEYAFAFLIYLFESMIKKINFSKLIEKCSKISNYLLISGVWILISFFLKKPFNLLCLSTIFSLFYIRKISYYFATDKRDYSILLFILSCFRFCLFYYIAGFHIGEIFGFSFLIEGSLCFLLFVFCKSHSMNELNNINYSTSGILSKEYQQNSKIESFLILAKKSYYASTESEILRGIIVDEMNKNGVTEKSIIPELFFRKIIYSIIYSIVVFILISSLFFRSPLFFILTLILFVTYIWIKLLRSTNIVNYLMKEIRKRPDENMAYVIASKLSRKINGVYATVISLIMGITFVILPLYIFRVPMIIYESQGETYVIRFYANGLTKNEKKLVIPDEYKGKPVVGIRGDVFKNVVTLEEIVLPETIVEIRGSAFNNAVNLKIINLPSKIKEIKAYTFKGCSSLEKITIPENVTRIGAGAFEGCSSLEEVIVPDGVLEIGAYAFSNADSLKKVKLSNKLTEISGSTFEGCSKLNEIIIPENVTRIGGSAFKGCSNLVKINIPDKVTRIGGSAFRDNSSLEKVDISLRSQLNEIGSSAFRNCPRLKNINVPYNATINEKAFKESYTRINKFQPSLSNEEFKYFLEIDVGAGKTTSVDIDRPFVEGNIDLSIVTITTKNGFYEYELTCSFNDEVHTFYLNRDSSYKYIKSGDFVFKISVGSNERFKYYYNNLDLWIYYN